MVLSCVAIRCLTGISASTRKFPAERTFLGGRGGGIRDGGRGGQVPLLFRGGAVFFVRAAKGMSSSDELMLGMNIKKGYA